MKLEVTELPSTLLTVVGSLDYSEGVLVTSPVAVDGVLIACTGDRISLTFTHTNIGTGRTTWRFSPPINCFESFLHDRIPDKINQCGPFAFENITHLITGVTQLSSTAVATVNSSITGTFVECSDTSSVAMTNIGNVTLCVIDSQIILQVISTKDGVNITWNSVTSMCTGDANYTVVVRQGGAPDTFVFSSVISNLTTVIVALIYDQDYTVSVTAKIKSYTICSAQRNFTAYRPVDCGPPPCVPNGFVNYTSTVEGAVLSYHCNGAFSPSGLMTSVCQPDGRWMPNPADSICNRERELPQGAAFTLTAIICFVCGGVLGMVSLYIIMRCKGSHIRQNSQHVVSQPPIPVYEDIHTTSCDKPTIQLSANVAYGQTHASS